MFRTGAKLLLHTPPSSAVSTAFHFSLGDAPFQGICNPQALLVGRQAGPATLENNLAVHRSHSSSICVVYVIQELGWAAVLETGLHSSGGTTVNFQEFGELVSASSHL